MTDVTDSKANRVWFDQGWAAFCEAAPSLVAKVSFSRFYVCPVCLVAFNEKALREGVLSREDVPPRRLGGRPIVLTCRSCNSTSGHDADSHAVREANVFDFLDGTAKDIKARVSTSTGSMQARLSHEAAAIRVTGIPKATPPPEHRRLIEDMDAACIAPGFELTIAFEAFSRHRARTSWLRSAYLAFFAALG